MFNKNSTICALSTPQGIGAIGVVRLSGLDAIKITNVIFKGKDLDQQPSHTVHFGKIMKDDVLLDEVVVSIFKEPNSYTGENISEISCHGSPFIINEIIQLLISKGSVSAAPGEFTLRAFLNGKLDLSQAEAVADLISSDSKNAHKIAMHQLRGGFSNEISVLRQQLIDFASLIELELDFSEEDVEFANRDQLEALIIKTRSVLNTLIDSFSVGNAIKNGIPVAIVGKPNAGKSTLLNTLLNEDRALVTEIAGTTRDSIEDEINLEGTNFRFIDTAGIRDTNDIVESLGVKRTLEKIESASIVILLFDLTNSNVAQLKETVNEIKPALDKNDAELLMVGNKIDLNTLEKTKLEYQEIEDVLFISAKEKWNIEELQQKLIETSNLHQLTKNETIVSNIRHWDALTKADQALLKGLTGLKQNVSADFIAMDIRASLYQLGLITGEITTDDLLGNIFSRFCIGK